MPSGKQKLYFNREVELEIQKNYLSDSTFWRILSLNCSWVFLIKKIFRTSCSYKIVLSKDNECMINALVIEITWFSGNRMCSPFLRNDDAQICDRLVHQKRKYRNWWTDCLSEMRRFTNTVDYLKIQKLQRAVREANGLRVMCHLDKFGAVESWVQAQRNNYSWYVTWTSASYTGRENFKWKQGLHFLHTGLFVL